MTDIPAQYQDIEEVLGESGFSAGSVWYHGTTSALADSILEHGLKRSGDQAMNQAAKKTMATIGNSYTESREPVYLTPSKALAFHWAEKAIQRRSVRFEGEEQATVLRVELPSELSGKVQPDVGAAGMLIVQGGDGYLEFLKSQYAQVGLSFPEFDLSKVDRNDYLSVLGLAYLDHDIPASSLSIIK